jgi:integrase
MLVQAYNRYAKYYKIQWEPPKYHIESKEITVPSDTKIKMLIATAKKPLSTKLQLSDETGIRPIELCKLKVKDYDNDTKTIHPRTAKHGNPRQLKISQQLQTLLNNHIHQHNLKQEDYIFGGKAEKYSSSFQRIKNTLAKRINDPSIKKIRLYDLRHAFCMRMIDHYPSDPYMVMYLMGHKHLTTTEKYFHIKKYLQDFQKEEYDCKHAKTIQEATQLIEAGYQYVTEIDGTKLFRKRK